MKVGIDCRMYGLKHAGIGRYVMNLVDELLKQDEENEYVLFIKDDSNINLARYQSSKITIVKANTEHYSLKEQLFFPSIINREKLDLMHFPHFNVPIFYRGKYVVTIHDLIKHVSRGADTTTRSSFFYWIKYLGYKLVFKLAVKRAEKIITPSKFAKEELVKEYGIKHEKVEVTYEGVDEKLKTHLQCKQNSKLKTTTQNLKPYLLYVGSVYPHKNIEKLIEAVKILFSIYHLPITLVIVCGRSVFWERLQKKVKEMGVEKFVKMVGFVPDEELGTLYKEAEAFVFPTLSEGFGLPGLEAMAQGCPVVCSDIPVLREVYGDSAIYFDPLDSKDMTEKIKGVIGDKKISENLIKNGKEKVKEYSWQKMASETLRVYNSAK